MQPDGSVVLHRRKLSRGIATVAVAAGFCVAMIVQVGPQEGLAAAARASTGAQAAGTASFSAQLSRAGTVNLAALARAGQSAAASTRKPRMRAASLRLPAVAGRGAGPGVPGVAVTSRWEGIVPGAHGFNGLNSLTSGALNASSSGVGYVSPPDPALAVGRSPKGTAVLELVNDALAIYSPAGKTLLKPVPAYRFFGLPAGTVLSGARAYNDGVGRWFVIESATVSGRKGAQSAIYLAVSRTTDPFGQWSVFRLDTSDSADTAGGCPCFDNLAQLGGNGWGLYVSANQYSAATGHFTGTVIYAVKIYSLYSPPHPFSAPPPVRSYVVPAASDSFGGYGLSPALTVPGSSGNIAEYFVESSSAASAGSGLKIYALINPNSAGQWPQLVDTTVSTEPYSYPGAATQRHGPTPYGCSVRHCATATLDSNFDAVQQVLIAPHLLYAELDTGVGSGSGQRTGAAWFVLNIVPQAHSVSASLVDNGYLETTADILDPVIGVSASGRGYMAFAAASSGRFPSAAYMAFNGPAGLTSPIRLAARGASPLDDFTCYSGISPGHCRFGDYSAAAYWGHRIYMAVEYVAPGRRDAVSNWSTRIWYAPVP
jgi:hypothetical protein